MTREQPHPQRCETCEHNKMHSLDGRIHDCEIAGTWIYTIYNPESQSRYSTEFYHIKKVGCASHSNAGEPPACFGNCDCCYPDRIKTCIHAEYCKILYRRVDELLIQQSKSASEARAKVLEILQSECSKHCFVDTDGDVHYGSLTFQEIESALRQQEER